MWALCARCIARRGADSAVSVSRAWHQDFYNLVDVYLDAVYHPACVTDERTFQQEGWCAHATHGFVCAPLNRVNLLRSHAALRSLACSLNLALNHAVNHRHYELDTAEEPITFKGVVFNEMKGVYSSPDSVLGREIQQALFPGNTYGVDSGGDPTVIPALTFAQFRDFHARYYHPSNSRLWFYGDDDPEKRLAILDAYLSEFEARFRLRFRGKCAA